MANAEAELKDAELDREEDYFKAAPDDLKKQFADTVKDLTEARVRKDVPAVLEKTEALRNVRFAITEAFNNASPAGENASPANDDAPAAETPAPAAEDKQPKPPKNAM